MRREQRLHIFFLPQHHGVSHQNAQGVGLPETRHKHVNSVVLRRR